MNQPLPSSALRVLVVEDIFLVAMEMSALLEDCGCEVVGPVTTVKQGLEKVDTVDLDGALLDVNLNGERSFPIAEALAARGVPFIFVTGYDSPTAFPEAFQQSPRLSKPVDARILASALAKYFRRGEADGNTA